MHAIPIVRYGRRGRETGTFPERSELGQACLLLPTSASGPPPSFENHDSGAMKLQSASFPEAPSSHLCLSVPSKLVMCVRGFKNFPANESLPEVNICGKQRLILWLRNDLIPAFNN
ncbi:hypothetical protein ACLOJK_025634 [Asimina triloba]